VRAIVWKKSIYDRGFVCQCGTKLCDDGTTPNDNCGVNGEDDADPRVFCLKCKDIVAVVKEYTGEPNLEDRHWNEEKDGKLGETKVYTVAIGRFSANPFRRKEMKKIIGIIKDLDGLVGFHPVKEMGTLLLFKTENDAKAGRNILRSKSIQCGVNIGECFIDTRYLMGRGK